MNDGLDEDGLCDNRLAYYGLFDDGLHSKVGDNDLGDDGLGDNGLDYYSLGDDDGRDNICWVIIQGFVVF